FLIVHWIGWHILELMPQTEILSEANWKVYQILSLALNKHNNNDKFRLLYGKGTRIMRKISLYLKSQVFPA
ncbi:hypothetical protein VIGAN_04394800, partial [Vigna angularis var. angularis]